MLSAPVAIAGPSRQDDAGTVGTTKPLLARPSRTARVVQKTTASRDDLQAARSRLKTANDELNDVVDAISSDDDSELDDDTESLGPSSNDPEEIAPEEALPGIDDPDSETDDTSNDETPRSSIRNKGVEKTPKSISGLQRELDDLQQQQRKRMDRIKSQLMRWQRMKQEAIAERAAEEIRAMALQGSGESGSDRSPHEAEHSDVTSVSVGPRIDAPQGTPSASHPLHGSADHDHPGEHHPTHSSHASTDADGATPANEHHAPAPPHGNPPTAADGHSHNASAKESSPHPNETGPLSDIVMLSSKAVDRLELANSLFAMGRTESAIAIYQQINQAALTANDRIWLDYQIASCHRRLGNLKEAEGMYRRVVAASTDPEATWGKYARWWLDLLRDRAKAEQELTQLQDTMKTIRTSLEESNAKPVSP